MAMVMTVSMAVGVARAMSASAPAATTGSRFGNTSGSQGQRDAKH